MAKSLLHIKARQLRKQGKSVKDIAKKLNVAKSSVSLWVRDVVLTIEQLEAIKKKWIMGSERGRLIGAFKQKQARLNKIRDGKRLGAREFAKLTKKEFLIAGLALYAGEGNKKSREVRFINSDPILIKFMVKWFRKSFDLSNSDIHCCVGINEIHRPREQIIKSYWSEVTGLPLTNFCKTSFKKVINQKIYKNFNDHYGTLDLRVLRSGKIYYKILGLIDGLFC